MFNACKGFCSIFDIFKKPTHIQQIHLQLPRDSTQDESRFVYSTDSMSEQELFNLQKIDKEGVFARLQQFLSVNQLKKNNQQIFNDESSINNNPYHEYLHLLNDIQIFKNQNIDDSKNTKLQQHQLGLKCNISLIKKLAQFLHRRFFKSQKLNMKSKDLRILQLQNLIQNAMINSLYLSLHLNQIQNSLLQYQFLTNFREFITLMEYYMQAQDHTFKNTKRVQKLYNVNTHKTLIKIKEICKNVLIDENSHNILSDWKQCLKKIINIYKQSNYKEIEILEKNYLLNQDQKNKGVYFEISMPLKRTSSYVKEIKPHDLTRSSSIDSKTSEENNFQSFYKENEARLLKLNLQQMGDLAF